GPIATLTYAPLAITPLASALGARWLLERAARSSALPELARPWFEAWGAWLGWIVLGLLAGVPWVAAAAEMVLPSAGVLWGGAARRAGIEGGAAWRRLFRPYARPAVAGALAGVFARTILEPAAPLILGLRDTLAFRAVEALGPAGSPPRAAVLGALGAVAAAV